jgi:hypothetical protein
LIRIRSGGVLSRYSVKGCANKVIPCQVHLALQTKPFKMIFVEGLVRLKGAMLKVLAVIPRGGFDNR